MVDEDKTIQDSEVGDGQDSSSGYSAPSDGDDANSDIFDDSKWAEHRTVRTKEQKEADEKSSREAQSAEMGEERREFLVDQAFGGLQGLAEAMSTAFVTHWFVVGTPSNFDQSFWMPENGTKEWLYNEAYSLQSWLSKFPDDINKKENLMKSVANISKDASTIAEILATLVKTVKAASEPDFTPVDEWRIGLKAELLGAAFIRLGIADTTKTSKGGSAGTE